MDAKREVLPCASRISPKQVASTIIYQLGRILTSDLRCKWPLTTVSTRSSPYLVFEGLWPPTRQPNIDVDSRGISLSAHGDLPIVKSKSFRNQWTPLYTSQ